MRPERLTTGSPLAESSPADQRTEGSSSANGCAASIYYQEGYKAGMTEGVYIDHNPYHHNSKKAREWAKGWMDGADKYIEWEMPQND